MEFFLSHERATSGARERPLCVALVLCNDVLEDKRTGNKSLIGLFNGVLCPGLPAVHPRMFLLASLTSGIGEWPFSFRITAPSGVEVFRMQETLHMKDPLAGHDVVVELRNLPLTEPGVHYVDLYVGDKPLSNRRFTVTVGSDTPPSSEDMLG